MTVLSDRVIVKLTRIRRRPLIAYVAFISACGARSGLPISGPNEEPAAPQSTEPPGVDDGGKSLRDAFVPRDALPAVDVATPAPDAINDCPDAAATLVYVVSEDNLLMSFNPPTATFTTIGQISCAVAAGVQPFSMAVDHTGIAYVLFEDGELFRVSTATASCRPTRFVTGQQGFAPKFGMAFVKNSSGADETLYVAEGNSAGTGFDDAGMCATSARLASIDTNTFALSIVGTIDPPVCSPELTGTGAGALFGFFTIYPKDSAIGQIDRTTARLTSQSLLSGVPQVGPNREGAWAFGFWGGDFYTFTAAPPPGSVITRFRPSDGSIVTVGRTAKTIVGAGVSTCAPQQ